MRVESLYDSSESVSSSAIASSNACQTQGGQRQAVQDRDVSRGMRREMDSAWYLCTEHTTVFQASSTVRPERDASFTSEK